MEQYQFIPKIFSITLLAETGEAEEALPNALRLYSAEQGISTIQAQTRNFVAGEKVSKKKAFSENYLTTGTEKRTVVVLSTTLSICSAAP